MRKIIYIISILIITLLTGIILYLSTAGIQTDNFNNLKYVSKMQFMIDFYRILSQFFFYLTKLTCFRFDFLTKYKLKKQMGEK